MKAGGETLIAHIWTLIRRIYAEGEIPKQWPASRVFFIYKKGNKQDPVNYRGIIMAPGLSKIYTSILAKRIQVQATISEEQSGF